MAYRGQTYAIEDAAKLVGCSVSTLRKSVNEGKIRGGRLAFTGGEYVAKPDIDRLLELMNYELGQEN